jgi:uncharacterized protein YmfQ (DUF2313 family)
MPDVDFQSLDENATEDQGVFDVTTDDYCPTWPQLLPRGFAWKPKPGGIMDRLFCALAQEASRIERRGRDLIEEMDPRTTQELLEDWERVLALPGPCVENPPTTVEGRRAAVHAKLANQQFSSRTFFLELAEDLGYPNATISSLHDPFICGGSVCGDPLQGHHGSWTYAWLFTANDTSENDEQLRCLIRESAQAHVIVHFDFPGQSTIVALPGE